VKLLHKVIYFLSVLFAVCGTCQFDLACAEPKVPIDYTADKITYVQERKVVKGEGNVSIAYKGMSLKAERVIVHIETQDIYADGNVVFYYQGNAFTGEKVHFNYRTMTGDFIHAHGFTDPWYGKGETIKKTGSDEVQISNGYITTCDYEIPHFKICAKKIFIYPGDRIIARDVVVKIGNIPILWLPFYNRSLRDERERFSVVPGYNKRFGGFVLTGINFWIDPYLTGTIHNDYYTKRGYGFGVDTNYRIPVGLENSGDLKSYVIYDQDYNPTDVRYEDTRPRYRVGLNHAFQITPDTRAVGQLRLQSDPDIINDFFRDEFEREIQPENYVDITKSGQNYSLTLFARKRMDDIFTELERLPELRFILTKQRLWNSGFYYSTENNFSYLKYVPINANSYDSARFDSTHTISYPFKFLHFLNLEPYVGVRPTFYTNGVDSSNFTRAFFNTGVSALTKIHKTYPDFKSEFWEINQLRHVIETRVGYNYSHRTGKEIQEILQFDTIDSLDKLNQFRFGFRNILQTRREGKTIPLVDFEIYTYYHPSMDSPFVHRDGVDEYNNRHFSDIYYYLKLRPLEWIALDSRISHNPYTHTFDTVDTDVQVLYGDNWNISFRHRYVTTYDNPEIFENDEDINPDDLNNMVATELIYRINSNWVLKLFYRYDFGLGKLEQQEYTIFRDLHCWQVAFTFRQRPMRDDLTAFIVFRLKAYPEVPIKIGN